MSNYIELTRDFYKLLVTDFRSAAQRYISEDTVWENPLPPSIPFGGTYKGTDGLARYLGALVDAIEMQPLHFDEMIEPRQHGCRHWRGGQHARQAHRSTVHNALRSRGPFCRGQQGRPRARVQRHHGHVDGLRGASLMSNTPASARSAFCHRGGIYRSYLCNGRYRHDRAGPNPRPAT